MPKAKKRKAQRDVWDAVVSRVLKKLKDLRTLDAVEKQKRLALIAELIEFKKEVEAFKRLCEQNSAVVQEKVEAIYEELVARLKATEEKPLFDAAAKAKQVEFEKDLDAFKEKSKKPDVTEAELDKDFKGLLHKHGWEENSAALLRHIQQRELSDYYTGYLSRNRLQGAATNPNPASPTELNSKDPNPTLVPAPSAPFFDEENPQALENAGEENPQPPHTSAFNTANPAQTPVLVPTQTRAREEDPQAPESTKVLNPVHQGDKNRRTKNPMAQSQIAGVVRQYQPDDAPRSRRPRPTAPLQNSNTPNPLNTTPPKP